MNFAGAAGRGWSPRSSNRRYVLHSNEGSSIEDKERGKFSFLCLKLTVCVKQVNREEALGIPTTDFLRCTGDKNLAKGQVGFFQFFVLPYFKELSKHIPELEGPTAQITTNKDQFKQISEGNGAMERVTPRDNEMMCDLLLISPFSMCFPFVFHWVSTKTRGIVGPGQGMSRSNRWAGIIRSSRRRSHALCS